MGDGPNRWRSRRPFVALTNSFPFDRCFRCVNISSFCATRQRQRNHSQFLGFRCGGPSVKTSFMGHFPGDWPSYNPNNFSQLRPSDPSSPSRMTPATYHPTHSRTIPPPDQVITTEARNILLRHFYQQAKEKMRPKRAAPEHLTPEHGGKQARASPSDSFS